MRRLGYHFWGLCDWVAHLILPKRETWVCDKFDSYHV